MTKTSNTSKLRTIGVAAVIALSGAAFVGCTTTGRTDTPSTASAARSIDAGVDATLSRLYNTVPGAREMVSRSAGVLVFPSVVGGSLIVGAEHGKGALRQGGRTTGYYQTTTGSVGFQAGAQSKSVIYVFNTKEALDKFLASNGWTVGADATVSIAKLGANGHIDSQTIQQPVSGFIMANQGLEVGASVEGSKITRITP